MEDVSSQAAHHCMWYTLPRLLGLTSAINFCSATSSTPALGGAVRKCPSVACGRLSDLATADKSDRKLSRPHNVWGNFDPSAACYTVQTTREKKMSRPLRFRSTKNGRGCAACCPLDHHIQYLLRARRLLQIGSGGPLSGLSNPTLRLVRTSNVSYLSNSFQMSKNV